jgi:transcriptional regulator with XRE-family HTH domain
MKQQELAAAIGVTPEHVSRILRGTSAASVEVVESIARVLDVKSEELTSDVALAKLSPFEAKMIEYFRQLEPVAQAKLLLDLKSFFDSK